MLKKKETFWNETASKKRGYDKIVKQPQNKMFQFIK